MWFQDKKNRLVAGGTVANVARAREVCLAVLFGVIASNTFFNSAANAESFQVSPLPLARDAKLKPDPFPEDVPNAKFDQFGAAVTTMITMHDYDGLEAAAAEQIAKYKSHELTGDDYIAWLTRMAPYIAGKSALTDIESWTTNRPNSYAAWFVLGVQYRYVATAERGNKFSDQTSRAQFSAMEHYALLAQQALQKSLTLSDAPLPSYALLIQTAAYAPEQRVSLRQTFRSYWIDATKKGYCARAEAIGRPFVDKSQEQLWYVCAARRLDPNASEPYNNMVDLDDPRWGGSFKELEGILKEFQDDGQTSAKYLARMTSYLTYDEAGNNARIDGDSALTEKLYVAAFDANPSDEHVQYLYWAMENARDTAKNPVATEAICRKILAYRKGSDYKALFELGIVYENRKDMQKYMEYMIPSAMAGAIGAQNNIGYFYMVGQRGLPVDLQQAKAWLTLAANQGYQHARDKIAVVDAMIAKQKK